MTTELSPWEGLTVALTHLLPSGLRKRIYHHLLELLFTVASCPWGLSKMTFLPLLSS